MAEGQKVGNASSNPQNVVRREASITNTTANDLGGGRKPRKVEILQITGNDQDSRYAAFTPSDRLSRLGLKFNPSLYSSVYSGEMNVGSLDEVYSQLQGRKPEGYKGHSLSVSDLIKVDGKTYFVDSFGFKVVR